MNDFIHKWEVGKVIMRFHNVFDDVLGNKTKVKLLRAFHTYPGKEFTESELQRIAGIPQASIHRNVKSLLENGLLERKRIGKANLYSLNKEHTLHPALNKVFNDERNLLKELKKQIKTEVTEDPEIQLAVLFGSLTKGSERPDSDVDLFIVTKGNKRQAERKLQTLISSIERRFGNTVSLMIKSTDDLKDLKTKSVYNEIKKGEIIRREEGFEW